MKTQRIIILSLLVILIAALAFAGAKKTIISNPLVSEGVTQGQFMDWSCYEGFKPVDSNADPADTLWWTGNIEYHIFGGGSINWTTDLPQITGVILKMKYGLWNSPSVPLEVNVNNNYVGTATANTGYISPGPRYAQVDITNYIVAGPDLIEVNATSGGEAVIGYVGCGVRSTDKGIAAAGSGENIPLVFSLNRPSPNPFNPTTEISFTLPESRLVELKIFDVTGRTADILAEGNLSQGVHSFTWDAKDFASGVYFVQLHAGSDNAVEKLILLK